MHSKLQISDRSFTDILIKSQAQAWAKFFQRVIYEAIICRRICVTEGWLTGFYRLYIQLWKLHLGVGTIYALLEILFWEQNSIKTASMEFWRRRGTNEDVWCSSYSLMTEQPWCSGATWILFTLGLTQARTKWITVFEIGHRQGWPDFRSNYNLFSYISPSITFSMKFIIYNLLLYKKAAYKCNSQRSGGVQLGQVL